MDRHGEIRLGFGLALLFLCLWVLLLVDLGRWVATWIIESKIFISIFP